MDSNLSIMNDIVDNISFTENTDSCLIQSWKFSKALKIKNYIWLFFWTFMEPMPDLYYTEQFAWSHKTLGVVML